MMTRSMSKTRITEWSRSGGPRTVSPLTVGRGSFVGANVTILPGVRMGEGSFVAAGAVVTADVPARTLVAGVPARAVRTLD